MTDRRSYTVTKQEGVAEVMLTGPGKGNAMGPDFFAETVPLFEALDADDEVRAIVLYGKGEHFSFGLDLMAMMSELGPQLTGEQLAKGRTALLKLLRRYQRTTGCVERCNKPIIAAVHGWCIGGGLDLAAACDIRVASADAKISLREVKVAIVADLGSLQRLPRIIGQSATREMAFTGCDVGAERALALGLVSQVLEDKEAMLAAARKMAREIAANPPLVVQGIKQVMRFSAEHPTDSGLDYVAVWNSAFMQSMDMAEAMAAFAQKRTPEFTGT